MRIDSDFEQLRLESQRFEQQELLRSKGTKSSGTNYSQKVSLATENQIGSIAPCANWCYSTSPVITAKNKNPAIPV